MSGETSAAGRYRTSDDRMYGELDRLCEVMHDAYERSAAKYGWETQARSRKPWDEVPEANKAAMRDAVGALLYDLHSHGRLVDPTSAAASPRPDICGECNVGEHVRCTPPCGCTSSRHATDDARSQT